MSNIFKAINQQKKKIKTLRKINPLIFFLLIHLIENNNFLSIKLTKRTQTTKKVFDDMVDKDRVEAKTFLQ